MGRTDEELLPEERGRLIWTDALPERIIVSPMKRCLSTAYELFHQKEIERGVFLRPMTVIDGFREMEFGAFEYMNYQELNGLPSYQRYLDSGGECAFPFGESKADFCKRVVTAGNEIFGELSAVRSAVIVAHGGTLMALLDHFSSPHGDYFDWQVKNGCGFETELVQSDGRYCLTEIRGRSFYRETGEETC